MLIGKEEVKGLDIKLSFFYAIWSYGIGWHRKIAVLLQIKKVLKLLKSTVLYSSSVSGKGFYVTISLQGHY